VTSTFFLKWSGNQDDKILRKTFDPAGPLDRIRALVPADAFSLDERMQPWMERCLALVSGILIIVFPEWPFISCRYAWQAERRPRERRGGADETILSTVPEFRGRSG
jgi:hypothetical protein